MKNEILFILLMQALTLLGQMPESNLIFPVTYGYIVMLSLRGSVI